MSNNIIPIFTSDASLGKSILTSDEAKDKIDESLSVSIWAIAKVHDLNPVHVIEDSFVSYIAHYKQSLKLKKQLIFGIKFKIVQDRKDNSEDSVLTESDVVVWMKNSEGYYDLIKLFSAIHSDAENYIWDKYARKAYYRGDWKLLQEFWTKNLALSIPFYDSFLHNNILKYNHKAVPNFGKIKPTFILERHDLPFDDIIQDAVINYCKENEYESINGHSIYYYQKEDLRAYQVDRCISARTTYQMPNMEYFSQPTFSFESWKELNE